MVSSLIDRGAGAGTSCPTSLRSRLRIVSRVRSNQRWSRVSERGTSARSVGWTLHPRSSRAKSRGARERGFAEIAYPLPVAGDRALPSWRGTSLSRASRMTEASYRSPAQSHQTSSTGKSAYGSSRLPVALLVFGHALVEVVRVAGIIASRPGSGACRPRIAFHAARQRPSTSLGTNEFRQFRHGSLASAL